MTKYIPFLVILAFLSSCKKDNQQELKLNLTGSYPLAIPECSGLSPYSGGRFLTVSDTLEKVYVISSQGKLLDSLKYNGKNPEGVTWDQQTGQIYLVEENTNEVVELDSVGNEVNRFGVALDNLYVKHGLEGITINTDNDHLFLVSEKFPGQLIEVTRSGEELNRHTLNFAKDYSSVYYDASLKKLWILSDDSGTLTRCTLSGESEETWQTGINKGEGVIVDSPNKQVYIISDLDKTLYLFHF